MEMIKRNVLSIFAIMVIAMFAVLFVGCDDENPTPTGYTITFPESNSDFTVVADKTSAEFGETVSFSVKVTNEDKYIESITRNDGSIYVEDFAREGTYSFKATSDTIISVNLEDFVEVLDDDFIDFDASISKTLVKTSTSNDFDLLLSLNRIGQLWNLDGEFISSNENVIPTEAVSLTMSKSHDSGFVTTASVTIDTSLVNAGSTWLVVDLDNPNISSSSYSCRLIVKLTVVESEINLDEWDETLVFDVEQISGVDYFAVTIWDKTHVSGSTNEEYQSFNNLDATNDKVTVNMKFIQGHVYTVSLFGFVESTGERFEYVLGESLGEGIGQDEEDFSRYTNNELVFLTPNESLTIVASAE